MARLQVKAWTDPRQRIRLARWMYAWRLGEVLPEADIAVLRGIEGARVKESYALLAKQYGIRWQGRRYDRADPEATDIPNQAINHAATAVEASAMVATAAVGAIPQLGFIHEDSGVAFCLDIADLFRATITVPAAFQAAREIERGSKLGVERVTRKTAGRMIREKAVIPEMIDRIKELFETQKDRED
jgi:CRISPR-associated protein Cas1